MSQKSEVAASPSMQQRQAMAVKKFLSDIAGLKDDVMTDAD
jgi:hypothetical protein